TRRRSARREAHRQAAAVRIRTASSGRPDIVRGREAAFLGAISRGYATVILACGANRRSNAESKRAARPQYGGTSAFREGNASSLGCLDHGPREPRSRPRPRLGRLLLAILRVLRRLHRMQEVVDARGDLLDRAVECRLVALRRLRGAAYLADELQRSVMDFVMRGGRLEIEQGFDVAAHRSRSGLVRRTRNLVPDAPGINARRFRRAARFPPACPRATA